MMGKTLVAVACLALLWQTGISQAASKNNLKPSAWVEVEFAANDVYDAKIKGVKDDVVGFLVADGVPVKSMNWFKPLFGNQNILLFKARPEYIKQLADELSRKIPLNVPPWTISMGEVRAGKTAWKRLRYGPLGDIFKIDMYWCQVSKKQQQVVVYWGGEAKRHALKLKTMMDALAKHCR